MKPFGTPLTYDQALELSNRTRSTLNRWVQWGYVRSAYAVDPATGHLQVVLSSDDIAQTKNRKWTRKRRAKTS